VTCVCHRIGSDLITNAVGAVVSRDGPVRAAGEDFQAAAKEIVSAGFESSRACRLRRAPGANGAGALRAPRNHHGSVAGLLQFCIAMRSQPQESRLMDLITIEVSP
jgi:hypothetical protein